MTNKEKQIQDLLKPILEISWPSIPLLTANRGYIFEIDADDRDRILGSVSRTLALLQKPKEPAEKPARTGIDIFIQDIEEIVCEHITEPAGRGCGYGITEDGQTILSRYINEFFGR